MPLRTDAHVVEDDRCVAVVGDGVQTVLSAVVVVVVVVVVVRVVRVALGVPWLPVLTPAVLFLRPFRL
jgi:hypothetical protein